MTAPIGPDVPEAQAGPLAPVQETEIREVETVVLDRQYRAIGISAVAAALRYRGSGKNPAYAQAPDNARRDARLYELTR